MAFVCFAFWTRRAVSGHGRSTSKSRRFTDTRLILQELWNGRFRAGRCVRWSVLARAKPQRWHALEALFTFSPQLEHRRSDGRHKSSMIATGRNKQIIAHKKTRLPLSSANKAPLNDITSNANIMGNSISEPSDLVIFNHSRMLFLPGGFRGYSNSF